MTMGSDVLVRLVSRDGTRQTDVTEGCSWEFSSVRSGLGESFADIDICHDTSAYLFWCDLLEMHQSGVLLCRHLLRNSEPQEDGRIRIGGIGLLAQLNRRRHDLTGTLWSGFAVQVAQRLMQEADSQEPLLLAVYADGTVQGTAIDAPVEPGQPMFDTFDQSLAAVHIVTSEHGGVCQIRAIGDEDVGPTIREHWLMSQAQVPPAVDADSTVNEVLIAYGPNADQYVTWPPNELPDPNRAGCRLLSPVLQYPEVLDQATAYEVAKTAQEKLSTAQVVLAEQVLDPCKVEFHWLVPGRNQISMLPGVSEVVCNLAQVDVRGVANVVTEIVATWDQSDIGALRSRVKASV